MAITQQALTTATRSGTTVTVTNHTHPTGLNNDALIVMIGGMTAQTGSNQPAVSSVTWNGTALTLVGRCQAYQTNRNTETSVWVLKTPATGAKTLSITWDRVVSDIAISVASFSGVNQTTPTVLKDNAVVAWYLVVGSGGPYQPSVTPTNASGSWFILAWTNRGDYSSLANYGTGNTSVQWATNTGTTSNDIKSGGDYEVAPNGSALTFGAVNMPLTYATTGVLFEIVAATATNTDVATTIARSITAGPAASSAAGAAASAGRSITAASGASSAGNASAAIDKDVTAASAASADAGATVALDRSGDTAGAGEATAEADTETVQSSAVDVGPQFDINLIAGIDLVIADAYAGEAAADAYIYTDTVHETEAGQEYGVDRAVDLELTVDAEATDGIAEAAADIVEAISLLLEEDATKTVEITVELSSTIADVYDTSGATSAEAAIDMLLTSDVETSGETLSERELTLEITSEVAIDQIAEAATEIILDAITQMDIGAQMDMEAVIGIDRTGQAVSSFEVEAGAIVDLLYQAGLDATAEATAEGDIHLQIAIADEISATAAALAEILDGILVAYENDAEARTPVTYTVDLTMARTHDTEAAGAVAAVAIAALLRQAGWSVETVAETESDATIVAQHDAGITPEANVTVSVNIYRDADAAADPARLVAGVISMQIDAGVDPSGQAAVAAAATITQVIADAWDAIADAETQIEMASTYDLQSAQRWLTLTFSASRRRTYRVPMDNRTAMVAPDVRRARIKREPRRETI